MRASYAKLVEQTPFQHMADTPTVKYYTDWRVFEERLRLPDSQQELWLPPFVRLEPDIVLGLTARGSAPAGITLARPGEIMRPMDLLGLDTKMKAFHAARWGSGIHLDIAEGASFGNVYIASIGGESYMGHHITIRAGAGSSGNIYIVDTSPGEKSLKTLGIEGMIEDKAKIGIHLLSLHSSTSAAYVVGKVEVGSGAELLSRMLSIGGAMSRIEIGYVAKGSEAKISALSSAASWGKRKLDVILDSRNEGRLSEVAILGRGAAIRGGYLSLRGSAIVEERAAQASSEIELHVTMAGEGSKAYAVPVLEIHSGEVAKGNHHAGVSSVSEDQLFYLMSRGLSREEAESIVISGILLFSGLAEELGIEPLDVLSYDFY